MRTLKDHVILYDEECPMCSVYTQAFVSTGMLDRNGRASYQHMPSAVCPVVDKQRAANEIALVNVNTGEVKYGIHSLFAVIAHAYPVFGWLFRLRPFVWIMSKLYAFISYNRRVIIPARIPAPGLVQPGFHPGYRRLYLLLTWLFTSLILNLYAPLLVPLIPAGIPFREFAVCGGQLVFQAAVLTLYAPEKRSQYLGNMMTVSFAGALLLLPVVVLHHFMSISPAVCSVCFLAVAALMFLEHLRRCRLLQLGWVPTLTWVAYRVLLLIVILYL